MIFQFFCWFKKIWETKKNVQYTISKEKLKRFLVEKGRFIFIDVVKNKHALNLLGVILNITIEK